MRYLDQFKGLPKQIYIICLCRIIMGIGSMTFSFSSFHLRTILGLNEVQVAWIMLLMAAVNIAGGLVGSRLADHYGRKRVCISAYILQILCNFTNAFFWDTKMYIVLLLAANAFGFVGHPVFSAMISDLADPKRARECFSLTYLCSNVGVAIGPSIGALIYYDHTSLAYMLQAGLVGAGLLVFALTTTDNYNREAALIAVQAEKAKKAAGGAAAGKKDEQTLLQVIKEHKMLQTFILSLATVSVCYQMVNYMLSMQTTDLFGPEISSRYAGFVWTTNGIVIVIMTPILLSWTRKNHHFVNMTLGVALYAIGYGSYGFLKAPFMVVVGACIWSLGEILISTGAGAFIASNSPASHVARCQSLYEISRSVGKAVGPIAFGYLLRVINYSAAWGINSLICALVAVWVYTAWKKAGKPAE